MRKPVIGLTASHNIDNNDIFMRPTYLRSLTYAGALPLLLPLEISEEDCRQLIDMVDGILFTGGDDIHPFLYGEDTHLKCGAVSQARDSLELTLFSMAMEAGKPIFGICRGLQLINVAMGGTLYQDLPSQFTSDFPIAHKQPFPYKIPSHTVDIEKDTLLSRILGEDVSSIAVNSMHHQAIKDLANGLVSCAVAPDQLIEAAYAPDYPFLLGVQWHPEHLSSFQPEAAKLFEAFVNACHVS